jgi:hypothetical protein
LITGEKNQQESDRILNELDAAFRDVGLLNLHKPSKSDLDQIPDDWLYMILPLWPGETGSATAHAEISGTASFSKTPENRRYLLVYYVPFGEAKAKGKIYEKKRRSKLGRRTVDLMPSLCISPHSVSLLGSPQMTMCGKVASTYQ